MAARQRRFAIDDDRDEGGTIQRELLYGLGALVLIAFGAFVWSIYGGREIPRITPSSTAYKMAPADLAAPNAGEAQALEAAAADAPVDGAAMQDRPGPETPLAAAAAEGVTPPGARPHLAAAPQFVSNGPYVAQIAALRSQAAVDPAWARLSSRAPELFASARLDIERADLGQRGVYYRVRAGYFADMENVTRFCDRIRAMGQDCIAVRR